MFYFYLLSLVTFSYGIYLDIIFPVRPVGGHLYIMSVPLNIFICEDHVWECINIRICWHKRIE